VAMMRKNKKLSEIFVNTMLRIILVSYSAIVLVPFLWSIYTSFKTTREFYENPWMLPKQLYFNNYINAFVKSKMGDYFINSVLITALTLILGTMLSVASAYVITRFKNTFTKLLKYLYLAAFLIPGMFGLIPLFLLMNKIRLLDNRMGLVLVYVTGTLAFTIYVLAGFFSSISKEYEESAFIDGCSYYGILIKIIMPMAKPAIITVTIFNFIGVWNEYINALTFITTDSKRTLPVGLANLMEVQRYATDWGALFAGLVIVMLPTVIFYGLLQRKITSGLNVGGLKI